MNLFKGIESLSRPISLRDVCCLLLVICGALFFAPLPARAQEVNIPDTNLRTVLEKALGKDAGAPITQTEMETLTSLDGSSGNISNLSGIELAKNLTDLYLSNNQLSDISPLAGLTNLTQLFLSNNQVSDRATLARLTAQTVVYFTGNPAFNTPGPKIEGPWLWTLAPTDTQYGITAASSGKDFLSEASGGSVTEVSVAANGATVGGVVGDTVWTLGSLASTGNDNVTDLVNTLGLGTDISYPVAYGVISVESPRVQNTRLYVGNGGPVKVWLNSVSVHVDALGPYSASDYLTAFPVTLQQGENRLFVSVYKQYSHYPWSGFFGFEAGTEYTALEPQRGQAADVNGDGNVTVADLALVALFYGRTLTAGVSLAADANGDGVVDIKDLILVAGEIDAAAGAPALSDATPHTLPANLTPENLAHWIHLAKQIEALDAHTQNGIRVLEKLLEVLTLSEASPKETALLANYPNPFNPETWIPYHLARPSEVTVSIYAVDGVLVRSLAVGHQSTGVYQRKHRAVYWDGRNAQGEPVASGIYFYTLSAGDFTATRKMLIRK